MGVKKSDIFADVLNGSPLTLVNVVYCFVSGMFGYCDTVGTRENGHNKQMSHLPMIFKYEISILDLSGRQKTVTISSLSHYSVSLYPNIPVLCKIEGQLCKSSSKPTVNI